MATTKIEWATKVWNPVTGCDKISEGCANCFAEKFANRMKFNPNPKIKHKYRNGFTPTFHEESIFEPFHWVNHNRVFVCSMGDLFHDDCKQEWIDKVFTIMACSIKNNFIVITKRPENMLKYFSVGKEKLIERWENMVYELGIVTNGQPDDPDSAACQLHNYLTNNWPASNIWLGVTAENQREADKRIPILLQIPAAIRFVSVEPMLSEIDIKPYINALDWVICGGETGRKARPLHPSWVRSLRDRCYVAKVPFFFKQWGEFDYSKGFAEQVGKKQSGSILDDKEWKQFPDNSRQVANQIVTEMQSAGLSPDQMLTVIAMARQKYNQNKSTNKTENICQ